MGTLAFVLGAASLLATPGPTNTLLATSGASVGVRDSAPLLAADLAGYGLAICVLRIVLGPLVATVPAFGAAMGLAITIYLLYVAAVLWRHGAVEAVGAGPVTFYRVFTTTLLNPKAIVFAFMLLPPTTDFFSLLLLAVLLAAQILTIGCCWLLVGAAIRQNRYFAARAKAVYRFSALVLVGFASIVGTHSLGLA